MGDIPGPRFNPVLAGLGAGFLVLVVSQIYSIRSIRSMDAKVADIAADTLKQREAFQAEIAKLAEASNNVEAARAKMEASLREDLQKAKAQVAKSNGSSRESQEALKRLQEVNARIAQSEKKLRETQAQVASELDGVKHAADSTNANVAAVSTEVREVKDDVASTRSQLNGTIADLKRVTGDMGVMSGLIATNGKEIDVLKQLGDRNYNEFTVPKSKDPVRVGDVWVLLKKTDAGHNRYTIELRADDRRIEKRDKSVNEPVQFYVGTNRQPHELVVNRIDKNQIVGYLAAPKLIAARQ